MANAHFWLLDTDQQIYNPGIPVTSADAGLRTGSDDQWSVRLDRLHGGLSDGVDVVSISCGSLHLQLLPTRGMGIWKGRIGEIPLGWNSPVQRPVHPAFVDPMRRGGIGWLDGFNELICRCGLAWHGAPGQDVIRSANGDVISEQFLPLHGRIANLPAHQVWVTAFDQADGAIAVTGVVDEASMFGGHLRLQSSLVMTPGLSGFRLIDEVTNLGSSPAEVEMLYHCNIGEPFLGAGSELHTACSEVAPRDARAAEGISMWNLFQAPTPGYAEQVYFTRPAPDQGGQGVAVLASADADIAFCVRFDTSTLPWFVLWKNTQAQADGCVTGLEPCSSFPNLRSVERKHGRVLVLEPGSSVRFQLTFELATSRQQVRQLLDEVTALQVAVPRQVHRSPVPAWQD